MDPAGPLMEFRNAILRHQRIAGEQITRLSEVQFNWKRNNATWSVGQCVQHINMLGRYWVKQLERVVMEGVAGGSEAFRPGRAGRMARKPYDIRKFKWRFPWVGSRFRPHFNVYTVGCLAEFMEIQGRLLSLYAALEKLDLNKNKIRMHRFPFFKLKLGDALELIALHTAYFIHYAQRIGELDEFPKN